MQVLETILAFLFLAVMVVSLSFPLGSDQKTTIYKVALLEDIWRIHYLLRDYNHNYLFGSTPHYAFDRIAAQISSESAICFGQDGYTGDYCDDSIYSRVTLDKTYVDQNTGQLRKTTIYMED